MEKYLHTVRYYKFENKVIGTVPSLDYCFTVKDKLKIKLPSALISTEKPLFHGSLKRPKRIKRVLVLTSACNLKCSYCYEGKEHNIQTMHIRDITSNLVEMFQEAKRCGKHLISFSLFGGEPTLNWNGLVKAIEVSEQLEKDFKIKCYKAIVTNGTMTDDEANFLAQHFNFVYFSFDGPKELFLQQRKPALGEKIYDTIFENAKRIYAQDVYLSFKVTVTKYTINHLKEIDDFFAYHFPMCSRLYQPCMVETTDALYISFDEFLEKYNELKNYSIFPKNMTMSLYKNSPSDRFCNLPIRNVVYPDMNVLACHRSNMCIPDDLVRNVFKVGKCKKGKIEYIDGKNRKLNAFQVDSISKCRDCVVKYHCCGGCPTIKLLSGNSDMFRPADYCGAIQKYYFTNLTKRLIGTNFETLIEIPEEITVEESQMESDQFLSNIVDVKLPIEER